MEQNKVPLEYSAPQRPLNGPLVVLKAIAVLIMLAIAITGMVYAIQMLWPHK